MNRLPGWIGWIPARGGSKGVPRKALADLGGVPLIAWTIRDALNASFDKVLVSTDDPEIADVARTWGAFVPELRPAHLSGDHANLTHALERSLRLLSSDSYQATTVCVLSPTNPFRQPQRLENALTRLATDHRLGCLRSMVPCRPHPADCATINREGAIRPIIAPRVPVGQESLSFNLFHLVQEPEQRVEAVLLDSIEGTDIDEPHDLLRARAILGAGLTPQLAPVLRALAI